MSRSVELTDAELIAACDVRRTRASGPGGQHRNKVETAVVLTHRESGIVAEANERRSQAENLARALFRLRLKLAVELRDASWSTPSLRWRGRVQQGRIRVNPQHPDFPPLAAEALDALAAHAWDVAAAAERLGVTASQLVKLLKLERAALERLNAARAEAGLHPLR
ncbi:MAG: peptide chain release factor-like protein [Pirellulales bacterium]|nr:peptide chain release factor-like protein [Pirellulales bacterium]